MIRHEELTILESSGKEAQLDKDFTQLFQEESSYKLFG